MSTFTRGVAVLALTFANFSIAFPADASLELQYSGRLTKLVRGGEPMPVKQIDLYVLLQESGSGHKAFYTVTERGGGGWAWPERFGVVTLDERNRRLEGKPAHALHTHEGTRYPVELPTPIFEFADKLTDNATWTEDRFTWTVARGQKIGGRNCWQVTSRDSFGRGQNVFVEKQTGLVVGVDRKIVIGRGDEFQVRLELARTRELSGDVLKKAVSAADSLIELQKELKRPEGTTTPELSKAQIDATEASIAAVVTQSKGTPLESLAVSISRDVKAQSQRAGDVADLIRRIIGSEAPKFSLKTLRKKTIDSASQKGRITILHFWEYKGEPLEEPYGQVGYLDFLSNRRGRFDVDVVGVAVDEAFASPQQSGGAIRSARKLRDFMNLSYPIATDSGAVLKKFGDPRALGSNLPAWIAIGADGKVAHFHSGLYSIKPDEGLRELDAVVVRLVREKKAASK